MKTATGLCLSPSLPNQLWREPIPLGLRDDAVRALRSHDWRGFRGKASNEYAVDLVLRNMGPLQAAGLYEAALLDAFTCTRTNNHRWSTSTLRWLFEVADRNRLLEAGDPMPAGEQFTLYRGVSGRGGARRVHGLSWTASLRTAAWFAHRQALHDPGVYQIVVRRSAVYAYVNKRDEEEFVVLLPEGACAKRVHVDIPALAEECCARWQALREKAWPRKPRGFT